MTISQISPLASATLSDILVADQAGSTGIETLQQVLSLFLPNLFLSYAGNPNGNVAGVANQTCYDTTDKILYICTVTGNATSAVWQAINAPAGATGLVTHNVTTTSVSMVTNSIYICNNGATQLTLPTSSSLGDLLYVVGRQTSWMIKQNANQTIAVSPNVTTTGTGGSLASTGARDCITLVCTNANLEWTALSLTGAGLTII